MIINHLLIHLRFLLKLMHFLYIVIKTILGLRIFIRLLLGMNWLWWFFIVLECGLLWGFVVVLLVGQWVEERFDVLLVYLRNKWGKEWIDFIREKRWLLFGLVISEVVLFLLNTIS